MGIIRSFDASDRTEPVGSAVSSVSTSEQALQGSTEVIFENKFKKTYLRNSYSKHEYNSSDFQLKKYESTKEYYYDYIEEQKNLFLEESSQILNSIYNILNNFCSIMQRIFLSELLFNNRKNLETSYFNIDSFEYRNLQLSRFENNSKEPMFNNKIKLNIIAYYDIEGPMLYYDNTI